MKAPKFEAAKLKRAIATMGVPYDFYRDKKDEYGEGTTPELIASVKGIYHETYNFAQNVFIITADSASVHPKNASYILVEWAQAKDIAQKDYLFVDGVKYEVTLVRDAANWNIFAEIFLEVSV